MPTFDTKKTTYKLGESFTIPDGVPYSFAIKQGPHEPYIEVVTIEQVAPDPTILRAVAKGS